MAVLAALLMTLSSGEPVLAPEDKQIKTIEDGLAVLESASTPAAPRGPLQPATPKGNPGLWVTTSNYPAAALRERREGTTRFTVNVGEDGRVTACDVTDTSGSPDLDAATCDSVIRRARFNPATDGAGNPTNGTYSTSVRWVIPAVPAPEPDDFLLTFIVDSDGKAVECSARRSEALGEVGPDSCSKLPKFEPYKDKAGDPVRKRVTVRSTISVEPVP